MKQHADARLEAALAAAGLEDSRPALRAQLKRLKSGNPAAFERVVASYETDIVPTLAEGAAPLDAWLGFARMLGELSGAGRLVAVDASGRATAYEPPYRQGDVVLHLPDNPGAPALGAAVPHAPTDPQRATCDLLLHGRLGG